MMYRLRQYLLQPLRSERGNVIILVGLMMFLLVLAVGVAVDMARAQILQQRISAALDAAGLAALQTIDSPDPAYANNTQGWVQEEAQRYFDANFPKGYLGSTAITVTPTISADENTINLSAGTAQSTVFMQIYGVRTMTVGATSQVTRNNNEGLEVVLVLDNTGSMAFPVNASDSATSKLVALKDASATLLNSLYGAGNNTAPGLYVGVVPFSQAVDIGSSNQSWITSNNYNWGPSSAWRGCVMARDLTDNTPGQTPFQAYYYPAANPYYQDADYGPSGGSTSLYASTYYPADKNGYVNFNAWGPGDAVTGLAYTVNPDNRDDVPPDYTFPTSPSYVQVPDGQYKSPLNTVTWGPNLSCPEAMLPMSIQKGDVLSNINAMVATGDTNIDLGMSWAYRMLSPHWRGVWGGDMAANDLPTDYNTPGIQKVVILMTDGSNHYAYGNFTAYNFLSQTTLMTPPVETSASDAHTNEVAAAAVLDTNTMSVCDTLKSNGAIIYTLGFGTTDDPANSASSTYVNGTLLKYCAGTQAGVGDPDYYFLAPTNAQLTADFKQIGNALQTIRVSK